MIKLTRELDIRRNNHAYSSSLENCKFRAENLGWKKSILIARIPTIKRFLHIKVIRSNKNNILMITAEYLFNI